MDKYDNLGIIGEGSYGVVIKCKHKQSGQVRPIIYHTLGNYLSIQTVPKYLQLIGHLFVPIGTQGRPYKVLGDTKTQMLWCYWALRVAPTFAGAPLDSIKQFKK